MCNNLELLEKMKNEEIAIHCDSKNKSNEVFKIFKQWGIKDLDDEDWDEFENETCYKLYGFNDAYNYCSKEWCESDGYEIWTFEKFMEEYNKDGIGEENKLIHTINLGNKCRIIESDDMTLTIEVTEKIGTFILKNMEEEIMKTIEAKIATRDNKQILTFLTKGLEQEDFNISSFKKYEDEHTLQLRITTKKGNQYLDEGHEEIIKIDRIFMPKKIKFKCNNGVMSTEFDCIDKSIEVEME